MSDTTAPAPAAPQPTPAPKAASVPSDALRSPQFIMAAFAMAIVAATVAAVLYRGNDNQVTTVLGFVFGSLGSGVAGFYFGSSAGSQRKDSATPGATP